MRSDFMCHGKCLSPHETSIAEFIENDEGVIGAQQKDEAAAVAYRTGDPDLFFGPTDKCSCTII